MVSDLHNALSDFIDGYEAAIVFGDRPDEEEWDTDDFHESMSDQIKRDCAKFVTMTYVTIEAATFLDEVKLPGDGSNVWTLAGHDFWLTRQGHGSGFWDGRWGIFGDQLSELAKKLGERDVYLGDDDFVYFS